MASKKKKYLEPLFPPSVFVVFDPNAKFETELIAYNTPAEAIDGDGPTVVAEYHLVRSRRYEKHTVDADTGEDV